MEKHPRGRDIILNGSFQRVSNGRAIKIWQHRWLPIKHPPKIIPPILESMEEATIDCLITPKTRTWNHEMIDGIFISQEAEIIKKIPLLKNDVAVLFSTRQNKIDNILARLATDFSKKKMQVIFVMNHLFMKKVYGKKKNLVSEFPK